jgi:hypothetical protein
MGKLLFQKFGKFLLFLMLAAMLGFLVGCEGDDGAPGADGKDGADGVSAPQSNESCNICHGAGAVVDIADAHPAPLIKPIVSNIVVARSAGDVLTVTFRVDYVDEDGELQPLPGIAADTEAGERANIRVYMADLVPAGTMTVNSPQATWGDPALWPTGFFEMWATDREGDEGVVVTDNGDGTYSFQMAATPADIGPGGDAPEGDIGDTQRVYVRADARDLEGFNRTMGVADFIMPAAGADTGVIDTTERTVVDAAACTACHGDPLERVSHGGGYQSPQVCNMCHSPIGSLDEDGKLIGDLMQETEAWLASLIHKIHAAIDMPAFPNRIGGRGYGAVTYPKNIKDCEVCHFDNGQDLASAWATNPTIEVCTTCHEDTTFGVDATHSGGSQADNSFCRACHPASGNGVGQSVTGAHAVTTLKYNPADGWNGIPNTDPVSITPNYTASIELSPAPDDGFYAAGDVITVTLTTTPTASDDYTSDAYTIANVYVYGPRAKAVPVLTPGSTTDPAFDPETMTADQGRSMLISAAADDPRVKTDADLGFKYELFAIPEDLAPGTYMVMAYATDFSQCSGVYRGNTCIDGWALTTFQVGTADDELRVAGPLGANDATPGCASCHDQADWGTFYHRSYFGTDGCLACHDQSGNFGVPIANRVHAVHSASEFGDLRATEDDNERDWSFITFPRNTGSCDACHTSGNQSFINGEPAAWGVPCIGCHGDNTGAKDHMIQNGAPL